MALIWYLGKNFCRLIQITIIHGYYCSVITLDLMRNISMPTCVIFKALGI